MKFFIWFNFGAKQAAFYIRKQHKPLHIKCNGDCQGGRVASPRTKLSFKEFLKASIVGILWWHILYLFNWLGTSLLCTSLLTVLVGFSSILTFIVNVFCANFIGQALLDTYCCNGHTCCQIWWNWMAWVPARPCSGEAECQLCHPPTVINLS